MTILLIVVHDNYGTYYPLKLQALPAHSEIISQYKIYYSENNSATAPCTRINVQFLIIFINEFAISEYIF